MIYGSSSAVSIGSTDSSPVWDRASGRMLVNAVSSLEGDDIRTRRLISQAERNVPGSSSNTTIDVEIASLVQATSLADVNLRCGTI
jgi:hypothetical protein